jgi:hypothetical protein
MEDVSVRVCSESEFTARSFPKKSTSWQDRSKHACAHQSGVGAWLLSAGIESIWGLVGGPPQPAVFVDTANPPAYDLCAQVRFVSAKILWRQGNGLLYHGWSRNLKTGPHTKETTHGCGAVGGSDGGLAPPQSLVSVAHYLALHGNGPVPSWHAKAAYCHL